MYHKRIILDGDSDAAVILAQTGAECRAAGLSPQDTEIVISELKDPLRTLIQSGSAVASSGGRFLADRKVETDAAIITLVARYGVPCGLFARLWNALSRGR